MVFFGVFIISQAVILGYFQNSNISADLRGRVPKTKYYRHLCVFLDVFVVSKVIYLVTVTWLEQMVNMEI